MSGRDARGPEDEEWTQMASANLRNLPNLRNLKNLKNLRNPLRRLDRSPSTSAGITSERRGLFSTIQNVPV